MTRRPIPLSERKQDYLFLGFFILNFLIISPIIDLEQLVIKDPANFIYPVWPPAAAIDLVHWWGDNFDPALMARPMWWKMTIWLDLLIFFPFYGVAIYAFSKGYEWIRVPTIIWASIIMTNVTIIMGEELWGEHATGETMMVIMANGPWFFIPALAIWRMWADHPFSIAVKPG